MQRKPKNKAILKPKATKVEPVVETTPQEDSVAKLMRETGEAIRRTGEAIRKLEQAIKGARDTSDKI